MPIARLTGNGMDFADAIELHAMVDQGPEWPDAASELADRNLSHARRALLRGHRQTARSWYLLASACFRFGQALLADDDPRKRALYRRMLDAFRRSGELSDPPMERVELPWRGGRLTGWLLRSRQPTPHPFVVQLCGIGGSREEYEIGLPLSARARNHGAARRRSRTGRDPPLRRALPRRARDRGDRRVRRCRGGRSHCDGRVGLWGNSAGGWLAALTACDDPRIAAVCMTGGTDRPTEILDRYPRYVGELQQMTGHDDPVQARAVIDG